MKSGISASGSVLTRQPSMFMELLDTRDGASGRPKKGCAFCTLCIAVARDVPSPHRRDGSPPR
ncbi:hypothetical protein [Streptomyces erythrochromogenes]|uniref:hypothetical protein n=1 Tax=Streptomyces erythrochromogenes TaxID=285574 RepID=UPI0033CA2E07